MSLPRFVYRCDINRRTILDLQAASAEQIAKTYQVDEDSACRLLGKALSPIHADMIDVAVAVYMADRISLRPQDQEAGQRQFELAIPVRELSAWNRRSVADSLARYLCYLTEDAWSIEFCQGQFHPKSSERQQFLDLVPDGAPVSVSLFSGGLDSFAGTVAAISENRDQHYVCVSSVPSPRQESLQRRQLSAIRSALTPRTLTSVRVHSHLNGTESRREEPTRRARGFLFLSLGTAIAATLDVRRLSIFENGIGALNLPYERFPGGIANSRAVHPHALKLFQKFVSELHDMDFSVDIPCSYRTKAEMCLHPGMEKLRQKIGETFSCDGFPVRQAKTSHCGLCTSCILRRLALQQAGFADCDSQGYLVDLLSFQPGVSPGRLKGLFAMDWQVGRIVRALQAESKWESLMKEFPELRDACLASMNMKNASESETQLQLIRLLSKHCAEWNSFPVQRWLREQSKAA